MSARAGSDHWTLAAETRHAGPRGRTLPPAALRRVAFLGGQPELRQGAQSRGGLQVVPRSEAAQAQIGGDLSRGHEERCTQFERVAHGCHNHHGLYERFQAIAAKSQANLQARLESAVSSFAGGEFQDDATLIVLAID